MSVLAAWPHILHSTTAYYCNTLYSTTVYTVLCSVCSHAVYWLLYIHCTTAIHCATVYTVLHATVAQWRFSNDDLQSP